MNDYKKKIDKIVEEALAEKTFSLEIVQHIKALKDDVVLLEEEKKSLLIDNTQKQNLITEERKKNDELDQTLQVALKTIEDWQYRETEIIKRETKQEIVQMQLQETQASRAEIKELVALMFRNPTVVRSIMKTEVTPAIPAPGSNFQPYPSMTPVTNTERETIE